MEHGKTSICRELIKLIPNTVLVHGGNIYRAIIGMILKNSNLSELKDNASNLDMKQMMDLLGIEIRVENNETVLYCKGELIDEDYLQSKEISLAVSSLGGRTNEKALFEFARKIIDDLKLKYTVILSGRGVLTIYPDCDYHLFITASLEERVKRKAGQYNDKELGEIRENIEKRDKLQEEVGYYNLSASTIKIDVTQCNSALESAKRVLGYLNIPLEV